MVGRTSPGPESRSPSGAVSDNDDNNGWARHESGPRDPGGARLAAGGRGLQAAPPECLGEASRGAAPKLPPLPPPVPVRVEGEGQRPAELGAPQWVHLPVGAPSRPPLREEAHSGCPLGPVVLDDCGAAAPPLPRRVPGHNSGVGRHLDYPRAPPGGVEAAFTGWGPGVSGPRWLTVHEARLVAAAAITANDSVQRVTALVHV